MIEYLHIGFLALVTLVNVVYLVGQFRGTTYVVILDHGKRLTKLEEGHTDLRYKVQQLPQHLREHEFVPREIVMDWRQQAERDRLEMRESIAEAQKDRAALWAYLRNHIS